MKDNLEMENEGFSGVVRLSNISDFIAPNLDCIIPLQTRKVEEAPLVNIRSKNATSSGPAKNAIKVSLSDCLACNGCVTSAETVLVQEQSFGRVLEGMKLHDISIATICPQTVANIAAKRNISASQSAQMISSYLLSIGFSYVVDSSFGRLLALELSFDELKASSSRPLMTSACPGFVCYAEKTHGKLLTPLISKIRSPQAIHGALVKDYLSRKLEIPSEKMYHVSVMPCFDKKLEASRQDFNVAGTEIREVDCVISTAELNAVLPENIEILACQHDGWLGSFSRGQLIGSSGGTSGGFAEHIAQKFIAECGGEPKLQKVAKNLDVIEISKEDQVVLRVARVYGFRNIQNVVRKLKSGKCNYDYVEVMACPSGCGNGGGQIREETSSERDVLLKKTEDIYSTMNFDLSDEMRRVIEDWKRLNVDCQQLLLTQYHSVETNISQSLQW